MPLNHTPSKIGYKCKTQQEANALYAWLTVESYDDPLHDLQITSQRAMHCMTLCVYTNQNKMLWFLDLHDAIFNNADVVMCKNVKDTIEAVLFIQCLIRSK